MTISAKQLRALMDRAQCPVLLLQNDRVVHANPAAQWMRPDSDEAVCEALRAESVVWGGQHWQVDVFPLGMTQTLVTLWPAEPAQLGSTQIFQLLAQSIRQPLSTMLAVAQTLFPRLDGELGPKGQQQIAALNQSFFQLLRLIDNLSDAALLMAGQMPLQKQPVELCQWLRHKCESLESLCAMREVEFSLQLPEDECWVQADQTLLERALLNLLSNALKFSHPQGHIRLQLEATQKQLLLKLSDDGDGLNPAVIDSLFQRAFVRSPLGDARWGLGLGLLTVRLIAQLHGGAIVAEPLPGGGSCMTLSLARCDAPYAPGLLRSPAPVYCSGYDPVLIGLSDALPLDAFQSRNLF